MHDEAIDSNQLLWQLFKFGGVDSICLAPLREVFWTVTLFYPFVAYNFSSPNVKNECS